MTSHDRPTPVRLDNAADHDRDIKEYRATITSVTRPSPSILRIAAHLPGSQAVPEWSLPNVAIRFYLDERYDRHTRVYTVREYDADSEEAIIDVVQHGSESPMMRWSRDVAAGDVLVLTGPRPHAVVPRPKSRRVVLFADDTAIPALAALLDQWPAGYWGTAWACTSDLAAVAELHRPAGVEIIHLDPAHSPDAAPLASAALGLADPRGLGVWAAGERDEMRTIRRHFRRTVGLPKEDVAVFGYWKRGVSNTDIDRHRKEVYERLAAEGRSMESVDDLSLPI
ncbi:siderophore-interacting protein [Corynebacterium freneyi]|uniref:siderophore-interacting protein n=1 Tax=Corynebacterium freneyi TaxID=134034 RepID=UPI001EF17A84|nr:SIP domain-containing protein [Corynebacterium freneyi]MCG7438236.1 SIP domain-containing protein [Corynebacterium freneyi]